MKKMYFILALVVCSFFISAPSFSEDFYGCWKAQPERKRDNIVCLEEKFVKIGKDKYDDISYSKKNGKDVLRIHSTFATILIDVINDDTITIKGDLVPKITYTRITNDEAQKLLK